MKRTVFVVMALTFIEIFSSCAYSSESDSSRIATRSKLTEEWEEYKKNPLNLSEGETIKFRLSENGGTLFEGKDFIVYIELLNSEDPNIQRFTFQGLSEKFVIAVSGNNQFLVNYSKGRKIIQSDGTVSWEKMDLDGITQFINTGIFKVEGSKGKHILYSPKLATVTHSNEESYKEKCKAMAMIIDAHPAGGSDAENTR